MQTSAVRCSPSTRNGVQVASRDEVASTGVLCCYAMPTMDLEASGDHITKVRDDFLVRATASEAEGHCCPIASSV